jgi:2-oxoglutarate dehydrogenase E1 component
MKSAEQLFAGESLAFVEQQYQRYRRDQESVSAAWREYFSQLDASANGGASNGAGTSEGPSLGPSFRPASIFNPPGGVALGSAAPRPAPPPPPSSAAVDERVPFLHSVRLFQDLPDGELEQIAALMGELELEDGEYLFHQGDVGNALYILVEGHIVIWRDGELVAQLGVGDAVGELAVLESEPRVADALARGHVRLLCLEGTDLLPRLNAEPRLAQGMIRGLSRRLRDRASRQHRVDQLVRAYRVRGHLLADLNPLAKPAYKVPELELEHWGLEEEDLENVYSSATIPGTLVLKLSEIIERMKDSYCGSIGVQYMHLDSVERKHWLQRRLEDPTTRRKLSVEEQRRILTKLTDAEIFEQFIHKKFLGAKRFSAEGAETLIPLLEQVIHAASEQEAEEIVIGMAHRGRLNVLANVMDKSPAEIFREFADADAELFRGRGDVKYHLGYSTDRRLPNGRELHLSLCFNPSHLEFVGPVMLGRVRAKQDHGEDEERSRVMGVLIHGDAAFAGQGVVQEMLNMSNLPGYATGGTLHLVVNNQIGFTTPPESGRSSHYATDVAKMLQTPIFHVNGEHPEAVAQVIDIAMDYRAEFGSDVIIDMYCYRRYGHNEGDEPAFTQPLLYEQIRQRKSVREGYLDSLLQLGGVTAEEAKRIAKDRRKLLEQELKRARDPDFERKHPTMGAGLWEPYLGGPDADVPEATTAVPKEQVAELLRATTRLPEGFEAHPKLQSALLDARLKMADGEELLDWSAGEALAFASLLTEGHPVRLSGQDSERGTFSHRHAVLHDPNDGRTFLPLSHLSENQARFQVWDSPLSEIGPMGFEFGYSLDFPSCLVLWEAQFGDFSNAAQVIIDQFLSSSEDKWNRLSGLGLLLPHGFEGQGPEHSSARLERFLTLCAEDNLQVVNLTTPAQIFHCLRRQVLRPLRKPLVVMSPKSLLRHPKAKSSLEDLSERGFQRVIPDAEVPDGGKVRRVLLCSGKVYYDLAGAREEREIDDVAIVRLEQYYPLSLDQLQKALEPYPDGTPVYWVQEEPENMGAWTFLRMRLGASLFDRWPLEGGIYRKASASPATGSAAAHKKEQEELIERALGS